MKKSTENYQRNLHTKIDVRFTAKIVGKNNSYSIEMYNKNRIVWDSSGLSPRQNLIPSSRETKASKVVINNFYAVTNV